MSHSHQVLPASQQDVPAIQKLLLHYAGMGELLPRSRQDIVNNLTHFRVIKENQSIIACGSLEHFTDELAEVRSLMVDQNQKGAGLGRIIVQDIIETSKLRNISRLMALTYVPEFFHKLGFRTVNKEIFPEKVWGICVNCYKFDHCDEIAVLLEL
ncbi:MAG: amino-acid N-acetyltransferase [Arenicella sp.]|jgi:amino-acid N-acetyltransferase